MGIDFVAAAKSAVEDINYKGVNLMGGHRENINQLIKIRAESVNHGGASNDFL